MKNNKKIYFEYLTIDNEIYENNIVRISKNQPRFDNFKEFYLYELLYYDFLDEKIKNYLESNFKDYQFYDSFFIQLSDDEFKEILELFNKKSDLELFKDKEDLLKHRDDIARMFLFLNTSVKMAQKDPKFWEV